jgi:chromosome segregation ATPase
MKMGEISGAAAERRQRMIREAAYYRAQRRGFAGGDPVRDWLEAEAEVDRLLARERPGRDAGGPGPIEQFEAQLAALDEEMRRLMGKAREAGSEIRSEIELDLRKLQPLRANAEERIGELRERSAEAWDELKKGVHSARHELNAVLNAIARRWP